MNSAAPRRCRARSGETVSRPSPESTMKRMGCTVVSGVMSVVMGRAQVTLSPAVTSRAAAWRLAGVIRLTVPSSSSLPQRPQFERDFRYSRTWASEGTAGGAGTGRRLLLLARVDLHHGVQEPQRMIARPLERVAPDDGAETAAVADAAALVEDRLVVLLGGPAREDHDAAAVEGRLHHVPHPLAQGRHRHLGLLVSLLGLR